MKKRNKVADYIAYIGLRIMVCLFQLFPIDRNLKTGLWIGNIFWYIISSDVPLLGKLLRRKHRDQMMENLRFALGKDYSEDQLLAIAKRSCQHLVMFAIECLYSERLISVYTFNKYVKLKNFEPALKLLLENRGALLLTGHYGSWEVLGYSLASLGFDITAVMRPPDNPYINEYLVDIREKHGLKLLYKKGASESMEESLRSGSLLGFIADQDAGRKGIFVDFFGRKASTYKSIALVALAMNLPVMVGGARRTSWEKFEYEFELEEIIHPEEWKDKDDEVRYITERFNKAIENMVRKDPSQYLWLHRRWKTRPPEERKSA